MSKKVLNFNLKKPFELSLYIGKKIYKVGNAPVGLLILDSGTIICKSEYRTNGRCDCTIVETGEAYCGLGDYAKCKVLKIK